MWFGTLSKVLSMVSKSSAQLGSRFHVCMFQVSLSLLSRARHDFRGEVTQSFATVQSYVNVPTEMLQREDVLEAHSCRHSSYFKLVCLQSCTSCARWKTSMRLTMTWMAIRISIGSRPRSHPECQLYQCTSSAQNAGHGATLRAEENLPDCF